VNRTPAVQLDGSPKECLRYFPRRPLVRLTHLFIDFLGLSHFPKPLEGAKFMILPKPSKDPKFPQNLRPISLMPKTGNLFEKVIPKILQRDIEEIGLLNASQFSPP
jgi:hypothetical protein